VRLDHGRAVGEKRSEPFMSARTTSGQHGSTLGHTARSYPLQQGVRNLKMQPHTVPGPGARDY
jgi:hypothetical protein